MKPNVLIYLLFSLFVIIVTWEEQQVLGVAAFHHEVDQKEAIRLRILANSDAIEDQIIKRVIRDRVNRAITEWVGTIDSLEEAEQIIKENLPEIETIVERELEKRGVSQPFDVTFKEAAFPTKVYGNLVYPSGTYNAVVITIGAGMGKNWWCVLFPPLCFIDMDNETEEGTDEEDSTESEIEVSFFIIEFFAALFNRK